MVTPFLPGDSLLFAAAVTYVMLFTPTGALFRRGNDWMTFVLSSGKARLTKVAIAHSNGIAAEIRTGLQQGQTVILHPPDGVADGAKVSARAAR